MFRIRFISIMVFLCLFVSLYSKTVSSGVIQNTAESFLIQQHKYNSYTIVNKEEITDQGRTLAYVFHLKPEGYIVVSADDCLTPVPAYSFNSVFYNPEMLVHPLMDLLKKDLSNQLQNYYLYQNNIKSKIKNKWEEIQSARTLDEVAYWPEEGTTTTGGWVETRWNQTGYYASLCPMDLVRNARSVAGCPSLVMSQILNYHKTLNGTMLNDGDDYHHIYNGNNFWIDDDYEAYGFPSFPVLNDYLQAALHNLKYGNALLTQNKASLIFASGITMHQIYSSQLSGTYGLFQAIDGYERFNFPTAELIYPSDSEFINRIKQNIMDGLPVHLGVMTPAEDAGHNVVVDGYNSDDYYHINFGWGGNSDGWYNMPADFPLNLTVYEGAIVDIIPYEYINVNTLIIDLNNENQLNQPYNINVSNYNMNTSVTIDTVLFDQSFAGLNWTLQSSSELPCVLNFGETLTITLTAQMIDRSVVEALETKLRVIYPEGVKEIRVMVNPDITGNQDELFVKPLNSKITNYPNPFNPDTRISFELIENQNITLSVYNLKGQKVTDLYQGHLSAGQHQMSWNGKDSKGQSCASGIYFCRLETKNRSEQHKMLMIK